MIIHPGLYYFVIGLFSFIMAHLKLGAQVLHNIAHMGGVQWGSIIQIKQDTFAFDHRSDPSEKASKRSRKQSASRAFDSDDAHMKMYVVSFENGSTETFSFDVLISKVPTVLVEPEARSSFFYAGNLKTVVDVAPSKQLTAARGEASIILGTACEVTFPDNKKELVFVRDIHPKLRLPEDAERFADSTRVFPILSNLSGSPNSPPHGASDKEKRDWRAMYKDCISTQTETPIFPALASHTISDEHMKLGPSYARRLFKQEVTLILIC